MSPPEIWKKKIQETKEKISLLKWWQFIKKRRLLKDLEAYTRTLSYYPRDYVYHPFKYELCGNTLMIKVPDLKGNTSK